MSDLRYRQLVTLPDGDLVDSRRASQQLFGQDERFARYDLSWRHQEPREWGEVIEHLSVAEALEAAGRMDPAVTVIEAVTRYRLTVHLDDRSRNYVAAFAWLDRTGSEWDFLVLDHITQGVDQAAADSLPTLAELESTTVKPSAPGQIERVAAALGSTSCRSTTNCFHNTGGQVGSNGHESGLPRSGLHRAGAGFEIDCARRRTRYGTTSGCGATGTTTESPRPRS